MPRDAAGTRLPARQVSGQRLVRRFGVERGVEQQRRVGVAKEPDNPGVTIRDAPRQKRRTPGDGKADPQDIVIIAGVGCQLLRRRPGRVLDAHVHLCDLNLEAQSGQAPHIRRHVRWPRAVIETHMHLPPDTADGDASRQHAPR